MHQRAAGVLDGVGDALGDERHVHRELLGHAHEEQVNVQRTTRDHARLHAVDQDRGGLLTVNRQVDQRVRAGVAPQLLELVRVDGHVVGLDAAAEDDGGQLAIAAQMGNLLAGNRSLGRGELGSSGGHAEVGLRE